MNLSKSQIARTAVLCLGASVALGSAPANALNARSWNGYSWARTGNLNIQLVNNVSATWAPYLQTAANAWSAAANIDFTVVTGPPINASTCSPAYGVVEVCSANYGKTGWLGVTNVYTSGGKIVMATIKYNDYYPLTSTFYAGSAWYSSTSCHELGHVLGLNHQDANKANSNSGSCLDASNDPSGKKKGYGPLNDFSPGSMDFAALGDIYGLPSGTQLSSTTYIAANGSFVPEPGAWALMITGFGLVGTSMRRRSSLRTVCA